MAQKRMFDRAIIDTDRFMDLSMSSKALYFLLGMEADDEGFVSYKKVMRIHGGNEDDIKVLIAKGFLIIFESGVVVITDWNSNNYLDKNRIKETEYQKEKNLLVLTDNDKYELNNCSTSIEENRTEQNRIVQSNLYDFDTFWNLYPVKKSKKTAQVAWKKIKEKDKPLIIEDLENRPKKDGQWLSGYIPHPTTYLNQERWTDDYSQTNNGNAKSFSVIQ